MRLTQNVGYSLVTHSPKSILCSAFGLAFVFIRVLRVLLLTPKYLTRNNKHGDDNVFRARG